MQGSGSLWAAAWALSDRVQRVTSAKRRLQSEKPRIMPSPFGPFLDTYLPTFGKMYRLARNYRRLKEPFATHRLFGFKFLGNPGMVAGTFEPDEIEILREMLPRTDRFVDVGANIGYYTCIARHMNKPVIAFEPLEMNLMLLYANLHENGWLDTEVWPLGLADYVGMAPLFGSDTGASLIPGWARQTNSLAAAICINTFDHVVGDRFTGERLLIKIDVEGFEMAVLRGGVNLFDRAVKPVVMIEIALLVHHPVPNKNYRATFEFFWSRNYRIVTADRERRELSARDVEAWAVTASCDWNVHNWLAIPEGF